MQCCVQKATEINNWISQSNRTHNMSKIINFMWTSLHKIIGKTLEKYLVAQNYNKFKGKFDRIYRKLCSEK